MIPEETQVWLTALATHWPYSLRDLFAVWLFLRGRANLGDENALALLDEEGFSRLLVEATRTSGCPMVAAQTVLVMARAR